MAKRFTDTEIWSKRWFRKLSPEYKAFWYYLTTNCDSAGVWNVDIELAEFILGTSIDREDFLSAMKGRIEVINSGEDEKWFLSKFIEFQYGTLSEDCKPHKPIIARLIKLGIFERVSKGYSKGIHTLQEKEKEKEIINNIKTNIVSSNNSPAENVENSVEAEFDVWWDRYGKKVGKAKAFKKWKRLKVTERRACLRVVDAYVASTPDLIYRKNPLTYLNGRHWEDEIVPSRKESGSSGKISLDDYKIASSGGGYVAYCSKCGKMEFPRNKWQLFEGSSCHRVEYLPKNPFKAEKVPGMGNAPVKVGVAL